ncbi:MAG: hypothetical protein GC205_08100 [Bacteroidetes bacterium]|nr:hypothetical protein [Bacteroidota bacterium]
MEIGDFAYLILLGIFWVFNALRQRKQKQEAELEEQREAQEAAERQAKRGATPATDRRVPPPEDPVKRVLEELFGQPEADTTTATPPLQPVPKPRPVNRPSPQEAWEEAKNADGRSRAGSRTDAGNADGRSRAGSRTEAGNSDGRSRAGSRTEAGNSDGRSRGGAPNRKPARAQVAEGYIDGESVADYANRTRAASRKKLLPILGTQGAVRRQTGSSVHFDLRQAVINDAILRRPYK